MKKIIMKLMAITVVVSLIIGTCGCSVGPKAVKAADLMEGIKPQSGTSSKTLDEYSAQVTDFALRICKECAANSDKMPNTLVSPLSVLLALSMTANGAKGETLSQMEKVLGLSVSDLNGFAYTYTNLVKNRSAKYAKLSIADSIWFANDRAFNVNHDFLQLNADYYGADIYSAPFDNSTLKDINNWVSNKTDGMIPKILDRLTDEAVMYLINALCFDAEWVETYEESDVRIDTFTPNEGAFVQVPFMHSFESRYLQDVNSAGFIKYYKGGNYAFAAILPVIGMSPEEYLSTVDGAHIVDMLNNAQYCSVITSMPKFETDYSVEMSDILKAMGMPLAFDRNRADFSGIGTTDTGKLYISRVLHKTYIVVDEKGTKAGAATVVEDANGASSPGEMPKEVYLTRPFIYMLIDCNNNIPLFIGIMNNPTK